MTYFVFEATTTEAQGIAKQVTEKETLNEGIMLFHQVMAAARANADVIEALCVVINSKGGIEKNEHYQTYEEEPEVIEE